MADEVAIMKLSEWTFRGGAAVPHRKHTAACETQKMGVPGKIVIPMLQHIGAPCIPTVQKDEYVNAHDDENKIFHDV